MDRYIQIHPKDNVAVALADLPVGDVLHLSGRDVTLREAIPVGHKIALADLSEQDQVIKYGYPIGHVIRRVQSGEWINEQVLKTSLEGIQSYVYQPVKTELTIPADGRTFQGYRRKNGFCGIRNEIWILPTVGCVNGVANRLAQQKPGWIDFNAGTLVEGEQMEDALARFICRIQDVASGAVTRNETNGYSDIAIFKTGVTL